MYDDEDETIICPDCEWEGTWSETERADEEGRYFACPSCGSHFFSTADEDDEGWDMW